MKKFYFVLIFIFGFVGNAYADIHFYFGGGAGVTMFSGSKDIELNLNNDQAFITEDFSGSDVTGKVFAGWRIGEYSALEFGLHRFGHPSALMTQKSTDLLNLALGENYKPEDITNSYKTLGFSLSLLGIYPLNDNFEIFGRLGFLYSKIYSYAPAIAQSLNQGVVEDRGGFDETGFALLVGGGASYKFTENLSLRVEVEYAPDVADDHESRADDVLRLANKALKDAGIDGRISYDVDLDVLSSTASIVWNF